MRQTKTLAQVATEAEEHMDVDVNVGGFDSFASFMSYYNQHYKPVLQKVSEGYTPIGDDARLLRFFLSEMLEAFAESEG